MRRQRLFNDPRDAVREMLEGYVAAHPQIIQLDESGNVVRAERKDHGKVGLVIGNGAGHEPAMIGWVGPGLFDVNVVGQVFSAPGPSRLLAGIRAADVGGGVLVCVSNHAGDVLVAREALGLAQREGIDAEMVILYDDVASAPPGSEAERRGSTGLFFVWKIIGALAEQGGSLAECRAMAERVRDATRTLTAAFGTVYHPISGKPLSDAGPEDFVVGVGVHGETAMQPEPPRRADATARWMTERLLEDGRFRAGDRVCVMVNNSGAFTTMELAILYRGVERTLRSYDIAVSRAWLGTYATTQDLAGFGVSLCRVDEEMLSLYDAPALGAAFAMVEPRWIGKGRTYGVQ
jgi:dihydroxyacetone kinase-like protein